MSEYVEFKHVYKTYQSGDVKVEALRDVNFEIAQGEICVIVGQSGAGKTTLIRLLLSYVSPCSGHTYIICGNDKREISADTRCAFAYVPQGNSLLSMTLRDNLRLANPEATDEEMLQALEWACADFITHNREGLDTQCGESGRGLSQGQAQRLCIARALLSPSPILLMDEATSALDSETEEKILHNIRNNIKDKTILFVTHRDAVIKYADETVRIS